jgi:hypothetical protein
MTATDRQKGELGAVGRPENLNDLIAGEEDRARRLRLMEDTGLRHPDKSAFDHSESDRNFIRSLPRIPLTLCGHSYDFRGPYNQTSEILDLPGLFVCNVKIDGLFFSIAGGMQVGAGIKDRVLDLETDLRTQHGLKVGRDYHVAVLYSLPHLGEGLSPMDTVDLWNSYRPVMLRPADPNVARRSVLVGGR